MPNNRSASELNLALLMEILDQPTAPFRESCVAQLIERELGKMKVPYFKDPIGNIIAGVASKAALLKLAKTKSQDALKIFIAHMDHPGFIGTKWINQNQLQVKWLGGTPFDNIEGSKIRVADKNGWAGFGTVKSVDIKTTFHYKSIIGAVVELENKIPQKAVDLFGGFVFRANAWQDGPFIRTRAADDLVGCFSILEFLKGQKRGAKVPAIGFFSRAEEIGYGGLLGHLNLQWFKAAKRPIMWVSLETSRQLPGAEIGKGPILRQGDRASTFTPWCLMRFTQLAQDKMKLPYQKRIMDGGACEASAILAYGMDAIGISVPLGNYHNQNIEGGPDADRPGNSPAPEFIHIEDLKGLLELSRLVAETPFNRKAAYEVSLKRYKNTLIEHKKFF